MTTLTHRTPRIGSHSERTTTQLVGDAIAGDDAAWRALVARYERLVWSVIHGFRLSDASAADVNQTVWLRLVEHLDRIRNPEALASWLAVTARHEALRLTRAHRREAPSLLEVEVIDPAPSADDLLALREVQAALAAGIGELSPECRQLVSLLMHDPPLDYRALASALQRPVGSIGPSRQRCIEKLRRVMARAGLMALPADAPPRDGDGCFATER